MAPEGSTKAGVGVPEESVPEIVGALVEAFVDGWNRHDATRASATFAPDGELTNFRGKRFDGRAEIEAFLRRGFTGALKDSQIDPAPLRAHSLAPTVTALEARWRLSGTHSADGKDRSDRQILFDAVAVANGSGGLWFALAHLRDLPQDPGPAGTKPAPSDG